MGTFTSKRSTSGAKPSITREHSGAQLKGSTAAEKPPAGPGRKPRLDVPSSGYGIRREKSGELRQPAAPARQGSGTRLKGTAEKSSPSRRPSSSRVKKSESQTSLGSTGSLEDSSESPRVSSGNPSSPSSTSSSRGSPVGLTSKSASQTGPKRSVSRENVRGSGTPTKSPTKATKNGEKK